MGSFRFLQLSSIVYCSWFALNTRSMWAPHISLFYFVQTTVNSNHLQIWRRHLTGDVRRLGQVPCTGSTVIQFRDV
jgi:hypothetical protein